MRVFYQLPSNRSFAANLHYTNFFSKCIRPSTHYTARQVFARDLTLNPMSLLQSFAADNVSHLTKIVQHSTGQEILKKPDSN